MYVPRGCITNCISGLSEESKSMYVCILPKKQYASGPYDNSTIETGDALINNMKEEKKRWEEIITTTIMTHNSRKAWNTIRNISDDSASSTPLYLVSANQVAHQLLINNRGTMSTRPKRPDIPLTTEIGQSMVYPFALRKDCPHGQGGGLLIFIHRSINFSKQLSSLESLSDPYLENFLYNLN